MNPTDDTKTLSGAETKRRWRECWQKRPFDTEQEAGEALRRMAKKNRALGKTGRLHVYQCPWADHYHVGHKNPVRRPRRH